MFIIRHFQCGNGPLVFGSRGHFKFEGANPASRRTRYDRKYIYVAGAGLNLSI